VVYALLPFAVLKTLVLILTGMEFHFPAPVLPGLNALISPLQNAPLIIALKWIAVFHCVVLLLNVVQATIQGRIPELLLAPLALARMTFAAQELCAQLTMSAALQAMCQNLTSQASLALDKFALIKTAAEIYVRTTCVLRTLNRTVSSIVLVSHATCPLNAVRKKRNVLLTTLAPEVRVMCARREHCTV